MDPEPIALLVDDNADDVDLALILMKEAGFPFAVRVARDGEQAWTALKAMTSPPALMILDVKMPGLGGLELLSRVRQELGWRQVPIVMLTSSDDERDVRRAGELGANAYIRKPSDLDSFQAVIERLKAPGLLLGREMARW